MRNVYLVGLPGSGKTTVGRLAASRLGCPWVDLDRLIEQREQASVPDLFALGEDWFRERETAALKAVIDAPGGKIVATGGGIVEREENRRLLQNEFVIFIHRNLYQIHRTLRTDRRPLLRKDSSVLYALAKRRRGWYEEIADVKVTNNKSLRRCVEKLVTAITEQEKKYETECSKEREFE